MQEEKRYKIFYTAKTRRQLFKLAFIDRDRVLGKIGVLKIPFPPGLDIKKMVDSAEFYRLRSGKVRVIFEMNNQKREIWIRKVGYRKDIYR